MVRSADLQTGLGSTGPGVLHMKDPPSKMQMGPQRAVAGVGTSKSDVGSGKGIMLSDPPVSHMCSNFF